MGNKELIKKMFEKGKLYMSDMEAYVEKVKEINIGVFNGEIDRYNISESGGLSLRGIFDGKMGYSYTEKLDQSSIDMLIKDVMENGKFIDSIDKEEIFAGSEEYRKVDTYNSKLHDIPLKGKIDFVKKLEKEALSLDNRVVAVNTCIYGEQEEFRNIANTKGIDLEERTNMAYAYISVIVKDGKDTKTGDSYVISNDFSSFDYQKLAKEAVEQAISMLGATSIKSGEYPVIFRNDVFANIIEAFSSVFSAENVHKGLSLLKDKMGEKVACSLLTLVDDPFMKDRTGTRYFDGEGTATRFNKIIENGILKTYFYDWKNAKLDGVSSTGNAYRNSYKSTISISPTNLYILNGRNSLNSMMNSIDNGLIIINVEGLHAGLNAVSGDFSLSCYGYEIENGKIKRPVNQITMAGNFYEVLKNIEMIGNDLKFTMPNGGSYVGSPSVKIKKLSISGE